VLSPVLFVQVRLLATHLIRHLSILHFSYSPADEAYYSPTNSLESSNQISIHQTPQKTRLKEYIFVCPVTTPDSRPLMHCAMKKKKANDRRKINSLLKMRLA